MLLGMKLRIYPTVKQAKIIDNNINVCRWVYNYSLNYKKALWENEQKSISKFDMINHVAAMKKDTVFNWLNSAYAQSIQASIANLDTAYKNFFRTGGYPKFKSRFNALQSVTYPSGIKILGNKVKIPKIGAIKARGFRSDLKIIKTKSGTISSENGLYFLSILLEVEDRESNIIEKDIGIDVGVAVFAYTSENKTHQHQDLTKAYNRLVLAQKRLSNKVKGSKNRAKAKKILNKQHKKVTNIRKDSIHKITNELRNYKTVVVEDLKIKNMSKSAKGTVEVPKQSSGKRGLNRAILQQSWGLFFTTLEYKVLMNKGQFIKVNPAHTSQTCSNCGEVNKENRKNQSTYICSNCGLNINADYNASINILNRGLHEDCLSVA